MLEDDPMNTEEYAIMCNCPEVQGARDSEAWYAGDTWLPSQRQIQDMIHRLTCEFRLMQDFYYWAARVRSGHLDMIKDRTMEQLWLMFYMWREHEKVWDKEQVRWVDERAYGLIVE
jgi:hypothetical protein